MRSSNSNLVGPTGWDELTVNTYFCRKRSFSYNLSLLFLWSLLSPGQVLVLVVALFVISFSSMLCWASGHHDRVFPLLPPYMLVHVWHWSPRTAKSLWSLCRCYVRWSLPYMSKVSENACGFRCCWDHYLRVVSLHFPVCWYVVRTSILITLLSVHLSIVFRLT
jgi:hypothetical protein